MKKTKTRRPKKTAKVCLVKWCRCARFKSASGFLVICRECEHTSEFHPGVKAKEL